MSALPLRVMVIDDEPLAREHLIGMLAAVYSSIFLATPVLVDLKEAEPRFKQHRNRVLQRRAAGLNADRKATKTAPQ